MRKISELEKQIDPIDGEVAADMPTLRKVIQLVISQSRTKTADDARRVARIVPKLKTGNEAEFTDEEFKVLKDLVEGNQANLAGYIQGLVLEKIDPQKA